MPGDLLHVGLTFRRSLDAVNEPREVEWLRDRPDSFVLAWREDLRRIADGHPTYRHARVRRETRAQVHDRAHAYLRAVAQERAVKDRGPCGDEDAVLKPTAD